MALKTSILVFYLRLSKNTQQVLRIASWIVLAIVNVSGAVLTFLNIFQCRPIVAAFSYSYTGQPQCIPLLTEFICSAPINIVTDLAILALPIPVLTGMRLPRRQKYILVITFSLGIFVTIVDVVRIYYLQQAITSAPVSTSSDPTAIFGDSPQFAWNASLSLMWSAVEVNIGMICACIPTLKPLIIKLLPAAIIDPDGTQNSNLSTYATGSDKDAVYGNQNGTEPPVSPSDGLAAPPPAQQSASDEQIDFLEFLTTPDMVGNHPSTTAAHDQASAPNARTTWMPLRSRRESRQDKALYFGFVNMKRPKSMIKTSPSESLRYCIVVTTLFLLWGFSYGLLNTLNNVIASVADMTAAETIGLTSAYFGGGYFFGPLIVGEWVLRHDEHARFHNRRHKHRDPVGGFKATFIMGLCIYGIGTIMFWPSAVLASFPGFITANFVVGFGLAVLETAANPFIILCGPRQYAETRILIAQGFQGVASVVSGVLAQKVFFEDLDDDGKRLTSIDLIDVQWTYLAITLFCVILALFFYYMPLPEVRDVELGRAAVRLPVHPKKPSIGGLQLRTVCIILAVLAQWTYVAAQESVSIFFRDLITAFVADSATPSSGTPSNLTLSVTDYLLLAHAVFAISRFNAAHLTWLGVRYPRSRLIPSPRMMLLVFSLLSIIFALLCVVLKPMRNPNIIAILAVLFFFAEGPLWPLIFAMGLRGQGDRTKRASAWLTMGASGPAIWPFVMYSIMGDGDPDTTRTASRTQLAFVVVVVLLVFTLGYPIFLTLARDARELVDPVFRGRVVSAGGGLGGLEDPESSGEALRDRSLSNNAADGDQEVRDLSPAIAARRQGTSTTKDSSRGAAQALASLVRSKLSLGGKTRTMGKKKREKARGGSSSTAASGTPEFVHLERRDSEYRKGGGRNESMGGG